MAHVRKLLAINILFVLAISVSNSAWAFDKMHLKKLKVLNACPKCDLSDAKLKKAELGGANLRNAYLKGAKLSFAYLSGANLRNSNLDKAILCITQMPWGIDSPNCEFFEILEKFDLPHIPERSKDKLCLVITNSIRIGTTRFPYPVQE